MLIAIAGRRCGVLFVIGVQPPNRVALWIVLGFVATLIVLWFAFERRRFRGPPHLSAKE